MRVFFSSNGLRRYRWFCVSMDRWRLCFAAKAMRMLAMLRYHIRRFSLPGLLIVSLAPLGLPVAAQVISPATQILSTAGLPTANLPTSATASQSSQAPQAIVSINLCVDQLMLLLAEPEQILSLSNLAHDKAASYYYSRAREYPVNRAQSEQVLALQPDLVIAGQYSNPHTVALLRELGLHVELLPIANDIEMMLSNIKRVAVWIGQPARGEKIVDALRRRLNRIVAPATDQRPLAAVYDPRGYTVGRDSLRGQMMELAGWRNAASLHGISSYGTLSLESLIRLRPDALFQSPYSTGTYSRAQGQNQHPALTEAGIDPLVITVPSRMTICAGPWSVDVIETLVQRRLQYLAGKS